MPTTNDRRTTPTTTMRAVIQHVYGSADVLDVERIDQPRIAADEVLIEVAAAGVDRGVWHLMTGRPLLIRLLGFGMRRPKQPVPGFDVSGRVVSIGAEVDRFAVGDEVFGIATGAYAEFAAAKQSKLEQKPGNLSHEAAAVATISGITALQALVDVGGVEPEQSVLVIGASGGVGTYTVQLAKALGASVSGVSSSAKTDLVRSLGADHVIDYGTDDYLDGSTRYDLIVDIGGRNPVRHLRKALTKHGSLVIVGGEGGGSLTGGIGRQLWAKLLSCFVSQRLTFFVSGESQVHIERLTHFLASGDVVPMIGHRFRLDKVGQALRDMEAGRTRGKSVIVLDERGRS